MNLWYKSRDTSEDKHIWNEKTVLFSEVEGHQIGTRACGNPFAKSIQEPNSKQEHISRKI